MMTENMTPADFRAIMGNNDMYGGNPAWLLFMLMALNGYGGYWNRGYGGHGMNDGVLNTDFAMLDRKLDGVVNGICDSSYANAQLHNGTNMNLANGFSQAQIERSNGNMNIMQAINGVASKMAECCCQNRYDDLANTHRIQNAVENGFCHTNFNIQNSTRDIIDNANGNTKTIMDALTENKMDALKGKIFEQNQVINNLMREASQQAQNAYLIEQLSPA